MHMTETMISHTLHFLPYVVEKSRATVKRYIVVTYGFSKITDFYLILSF